MWDEILRTGGEADMTKKPSYSHSIEPPLSDLLWATPSDFTPLRPLLASFLALWLTICRIVDPLSEQRTLHITFEQVLEDWKDKEELCLPNPFENEQKVLLVHWPDSLTG
jgi:hypothetical protein